LAFTQKVVSTIPPPHSTLLIHSSNTDWREERAPTLKPWELVNQELKLKTNALSCGGPSFFLLFAVLLNHAIPSETPLLLSSSLIYGSEVVNDCFTPSFLLELGELWRAQSPSISEGLFGSLFGSQGQARQGEEALGLVAQAGVLISSSRGDRQDVISKTNLPKSPFQKLPLPLLISCGLGGLGLLPVHPSRV
jgi:hypothetical protein